MIVHKIETYAMRMKTWTWLCTKCWRFFSTLWKCFHFHTLEMSAFTTEKLDEWLRYTFVPLLYSNVVTMHFTQSLCSLPTAYVKESYFLLYNWKIFGTIILNNFSFFLCIFGILGCLTMFSHDLVNKYQAYKNEISSLKFD